MPAKKPQLDLFAELPAVAPDTKSEHGRPGTGIGMDTDASQMGRNPPATAIIPEPPGNLPPNVRWRSVTAAQQTIGFMLRRSRRRTIGLTINDDGLVVTAPGWVSVGQIDNAVRDKAGWILSKLALRRERAEQLATAETEWQHGGRVPFLGKRIALALSPQHRHHHFEGDTSAPDDGDVLFLALPADADRDRVRDTTHAWLQQQARRLFEARLQHFLAAENLQIRRWRLSSASTRWGSCSSDGNIMLNWRLIHFAPNIIDYVIVHEIAHLRHMNHSPAFWQEVERLLPNFAPLRDALRCHHPASLPLL
jgi:predicted metal-dependent hydrolase